MKKHWEEKLDKILEDRDHFGHNTEVDIRKYLRKIEKLCAFVCDIDVVNEYTVRITMPEIVNLNAPFRENILLHILTTPPMPTECRYNKNKDRLTIEWHY